eukprot:CAMPEP_0194228426 /NCGR_PEP_ID=MMETSP0156-20130528/43367_1 /TAXON_ID=33649 /ORGANISM="Thalassionema nitzschioides, Strain L26-B" /LENGTH=629 /DNA_ID=CAMNT_0038960939 /DNA_START=9 /DNA_END=1894 /DNA_ORIENTATION=-
MEEAAPYPDAAAPDNPDTENMTQLQTYIESMQWEEAEKRLKTNPSEMYSRSSKGGESNNSASDNNNTEVTTALHLALELGECPFPLMRTMIEIDPLLPSVLDKNGNTPLHIACSGEFAYDPLVICTLLVAFPQAVMIKEKLEGTTPLHMLLLMAGDINTTCLTLLLDVAYSPVAGLPLSYVLAVEFLTSPLETSTQIAQHYPPIAIMVAREMAMSDPYAFPAFLRPLIHLPKPTSLVTEPKLVAGQERILVVRDDSKQVPLHIAARRCVPSEVVDLLLDEKRYPGAMEACHMLERKDRVPLHYCGIYGMIGKAAQKIYQENPKATLDYELYGLTPYQLAMNGYQCTLNELSLKVNKSRQKEEIHFDFDDECQQLKDYFVELRSWKHYLHTAFFLNITYQETFGRPFFSVVHAVASIVSTPHFLRCNLALYPHLVSTYDHDGHLPLHLACRVTRPDGINESFYWMQENTALSKFYFRLIPETLEEDNPISILVKEYPQAASVLDTETGNLPLHAAILSGKTMADGIRSLMNAAPMALSTRNLQHGLFPFQLAAMMDAVTSSSFRRSSSSSNSNNRQQSTVNLDGLDNIFELLLANPMMVMTGATTIVLTEQQQQQQRNSTSPCNSDFPPP